MAIELIGVQAEQLPLVWEQVAPLLEKVFAHSNGEHTLETIYPLLANRDAQLWIGCDKEIVHAGLTQVITFKTGKQIVEIFFLGGERMDEWLPHIDIIEKWAKQIGCSEVRISGRKGWEKVMKEYKPIYTTLSKRI